MRPLSPGEEGGRDTTSFPSFFHSLLIPRFLASRLLSQVKLGFWNHPELVCVVGELLLTSILLGFEVVQTLRQELQSTLLTSSPMLQVSISQMLLGSVMILIQMPRCRYEKMKMEKKVRLLRSAHCTRFVAWGKREHLCVSAWNTAYRTYRAVLTPSGHEPLLATQETEC